MNKNIIIAIVASSILLIVSVIVWVIVSRRWPSSAIDRLHKKLKFIMDANERGCVIDYITSISFRKYNNMNDIQRGKLFLRALNHCNVSPPSGLDLDGVTNIF